MTRGKRILVKTLYWSFVVVGRIVQGIVCLWFLFAVVMAIYFSIWQHTREFLDIGAGVLIVASTIAFLFWLWDWVAEQYRWISWAENYKKKDDDK